jgi:hypothetical protein
MTNATTKKSLGDLVQEKLDRQTAATRAAADQEAERKRREVERAALLARRLDALELEIVNKCTEANAAKADLVQYKRLASGFEISFAHEKLVIHVESLGDSVVDFWGFASVQRWRRDFYLMPNGQFVDVRFKPNPGISRPGPEQHPSDGQQFRHWAVDFAKSLAPISPQQSGMALGDFLHENVAKLIELAG